MDMDTSQAVADDFDTMATNNRLDRASSRLKRRSRLGQGIDHHVFSSFDNGKGQGIDLMGKLKIWFSITNVD